jgi:CobQ-like glutamine amidotransferase family enzyme
MRMVKIAHLYPDEMNIYGDLGNIISLTKRLEWRGYTVRVMPVEVGKSFDFNQVDLVFGGGGQDSGQHVIGADLAKRGNEIRKVAANGMPMLVICGTYQLFGESFTTLEGNEIPGIGVFNMTTVGSGLRMIGNVVIQSPFGRLVGFENHSGQTKLKGKQQPLGSVKKGYGNNSKSRHEGAITGNVLGSYMHGPLLPKNPRLADHLISVALKRMNDTSDLALLDDRLERAAADSAASRP